MNFRFLLIPVLITTAAFAQGRRFQTTPNGSAPPPTPEQAATREGNMIAAAVGLSAANTSALLADLACASSATSVTATTPCALTAEQNVLQANAATLKTSYSTLATELSSTPPGSTAATVTAINGVELVNLEARVAAAGAVLAELDNLKVTLTSTQQTQFINRLVSGFGGFRR
jgi:hypothetical protein